MHSTPTCPTCGKACIINDKIRAMESFVLCCTYCFNRFRVEKVRVEILYRSTKIKSPRIEL